MIRKNSQIWTEIIDVFECVAACKSECEYLCVSAWEEVCVSVFVCVFVSK